MSIPHLQGHEDHVVATNRKAPSPGVLTSTHMSGDTQYLDAALGQHIDPRLPDSTRELSTFLSESVTFRGKWIAAVGGERGERHRGGRLNISGQTSGVIKSLPSEAHHSRLNISPQCIISAYRVCLDVCCYKSRILL